MPRTGAKVTQADIARVLRAIAQSGMKMSLEISPDGTLRLHPSEVAIGEAPTQYRGEIKLW
jgi:hypothetical protein